MTARRLIQVAAAVLVVTVAILLLIGRANDRRQAIFRSNPVGVMGTQCSIQVVAPVGGERLARCALAAAETEFRAVEARMSVKLESTEVSRLNAARAGEHVSLSADSLAVLSAARQAAVDTDGAFDVTCRPIIELWKQAATSGRPPTAEQLAQARTMSHWDQITLDADGAAKTADTACVDLGGLAKGYAADMAAEAMMRTGIRAGIAQAGGDTRCFGTKPDGEPWRIGIRNPFDPQSVEPVATLLMTSGAVCTSGNYFRFVEIQGRRFSHIVDPRPGPRVGMTADAAASVTVVAPMGMTADIWATALSVLGPDGFKLLPADGSIQALIIDGDRDNYHVHMTKGFAALMAEPSVHISSPPSSAPATHPAEGD